MKDITAVGEILIDLTQTGVNENGIPVFAANPGGSPANVAVAAARLGAHTAFIGKTGDDELGAFLCDPQQISAFRLRQPLQRHCPQRSNSCYARFS